MADGVLVVIMEAGAGPLPASAQEALGLGARVAALLGTGWEAAVLSDTPAAADECAERGAERVFTLPAGASLAVGEAATGTVAGAARRSGARAVVVSRGSPVLDLVPRLGVRLGGGAVTGVTEALLEGGELQVVASIYGGAARARYRFHGGGAPVLSGAPGAGQAPPRVAGRTAPREVIEPAAATRVRVVEPLRAPEGARLEDARVVVSGGRGLRESGNYHLVEDLAEALGGMPGASRAIVDDGWATPARQVGLTGKVVSPDLYVAAGISGASQHMAGCATSRILVAINTDPDAPIFRYAQLGIVDDCQAVLPELIRLVRERRGSR